MDQLKAIEHLKLIKYGETIEIKFDTNPDENRIRYDFDFGFAIVSEKFADNGDVFYMLDYITTTERGNDHSIEILAKLVKQYSRLVFINNNDSFWKHLANKKELSFQVLISEEEYWGMIFKSPNN